MPSTRKRSIEAEGRKAAEDELARALREIDRAKDGAIQELAVASANVAIDLAGKVIRDKLTPEQNNQLVREALAKLAPRSRVRISRSGFRSLIGKRSLYMTESACERPTIQWQSNAKSRSTTP